jgi:hypothetical protein
MRILLGRLENALAGCPGDLKNDVGALGILGFRQGLAKGRIVPAVGKRTNDLNVRICIAGPLLEADNEI